MCHITIVSLPAVLPESGKSQADSAAHSHAAGILILFYITEEVSMYYLTNRRPG